MNTYGSPIAPKTILVIPFDLLAHYLRCIELVRRYQGAEVFFASSQKYNSLVRQAGHSVVQIEKFNTEQVMACTAKFDFSWLNKNDIECTFLSQAGMMEKLRPDLVIGDTAPTLKMAAEYAGVPYLALMNGYMSRYYACARSLSQTHPAYKILSVFPRLITTPVVRLAERISFRLVHLPFRQLRKKYKLRYVSDYLREIEGDENLICDEEYLFPQNRLPENYRVIGPLIYDGFQQDEEWLRQLPAGKKIILVCMGSSGSWEPLSFMSSADYADITIITAGDAKCIITGGHVLSKSFISLDSVLPHCSMLICHGGNGTIYHGLRHKVPILCLTSHFEQEWNVQRLETLNLGWRINSNPKSFIDACLHPIRQTKGIPDQAESGQVRLKLQNGTA